MTPGPVVEHFCVIDDISPGQIPGFIDALSDTLLFSELKNDSATTLSQTLPRWLILGARLCELLVESPSMF